MVRRSGDRPRARARASRQRVDAADHDLELAGGDGAEQVADHRRDQRRGAASRCTSQKPITDFGVAQQVAGRDLVAARGRRSRRRPSARTAPAPQSSASKAAPPLICEHRRRPARRRWPRGSPPSRSSARESTVASAPSRSTSARFSSLEASAITLAAGALGELDGEACRCRRAAASTTTVSPASTRAQRWTQRVRGQALQQQRRRPGRRRPRRGPGPASASGTATFCA